MYELGQEQAIAAGDVLHQFKMIRTLGAGFHGEVWLAEHVHTGVPFAFKFMHLEDSKDAKKVRRALETAKGTYRIDHANVIKVHDLGCEPSGMVWLRMDYLEGKSVAELLRQGALSLLVALDIAIEVAWGLAAAHELGIIHRDIKPDNVFMTRNGVIVVLDFSIAKVISAGIRTTVRKTGMGTAPYMAPEHLGGAHPDARFDIYALGIMLWEMITGYHPFHDVLRDTEALIRRQLHVNPAPLSVVAQLPVEVDEIIRRATAKDPAARYGTIVEMAQAMARLKSWLLTEVDAQRLMLTKRRGEPTVNNPRGRKDYHRDATPDGSLAPPLPLPSQRVVVLAPASLPQTLPLPEAVGPGGTLPFGANILEMAAQQRAATGAGLCDTAVLEPVAPTLGTRSASTATAGRPDEAERVSGLTPRRSAVPPWLPIAILATVFGVVTAGVVLHSIVRRRSPVALMATSTAPTSASPAPLPPDAPEATTSVGPKPSSAPDLPVPISSDAPRVTPPPPKRPSSRPPPTTPAPTATPAPTFQPLFSLPK
jgi:serine/threonine-protein kinase